MSFSLFLVSAPEKVAGENVGVAADIWGVGVLAFILLVLLFSQMKYTYVATSLSSWLGRL
jgi:hypothetical protein